MIVDKTKSLEELEGEVMSEPDVRTSLTNSVFRLWTTPLIEYSTEDLRLMIGQEIGLKFLIPIAIDKLIENPFAEGDLFFGDLLSSVLRVNPSFWISHPQIYYEVIEIVAGLPEILNDLIQSINKFEEIEV